MNSHSTNAAWAECSDQAISRQEDRLKRVWNLTYAAMKRRSPVAAAELLAEQRAWGRYKDIACRYYRGGAFGREGDVLHFGACLVSLIADRIAALDGIKSDAEGN